MAIGQNKYTELDKIAVLVANKTSNEINRRVRNIKSEMICKSQYVLEHVIRILESRV